LFERGAYLESHGPGGGQLQLGPGRGVAGGTRAALPRFERAEPTAAAQANTTETAAVIASAIASVPTTGRTRKYSASGASEAAAAQAVNARRDCVARLWGDAAGSGWRGTSRVEMVRIHPASAGSTKKPLTCPSTLNATRPSRSPRSKASGTSTTV